MNDTFRKYVNRLRVNSGMDSLNKTQKIVGNITLLLSGVLFLFMFIFGWPIYLGVIAVVVHLTAFRFFK